MSADDNVIENRLKKDIDNLKREKKVLLGDIEVGSYISVSDCLTGPECSDFRLAVQIPATK